MSELYEKSLLKLELDKILQMLADSAGSQGGKDACLQLRPSSDLEEVQLMLQQTTDASDLCTRKGNPAFGDVNDIKITRTYKFAKEKIAYLFANMSFDDFNNPVAYVKRVIDVDCVDETDRYKRIITEY